MHLVLDVDGVLLDWFGGFYAWMAETGRPAKRPFGESYGMNESWPDMPDATLQDFVVTFNMTPSFGELPLMAGALNFVRDFRQKHPDVKIVAVTKCGLAPVTQRMRLTNLRHFMLDEVQMLPREASKLDSFKRFRRYNTIVVDDSPSGLADAQNAGLIPVAFDYPFNRAIYVSRIKGWIEARERITDVYYLLKRCAA